MFCFFLSSLCVAAVADFQDLGDCPAIHVNFFLTVAGSTAEISDEAGDPASRNGIEEKQSNLVMVNGCYVDVEQLLLRLHQSEESRRETENQFKISQMQLCKNRVMVVFSLVLSLAMKCFFFSFV